jgi:hypothetical protein
MSCPVFLCSQQQLLRKEPHRNSGLPVKGGRTMAAPTLHPLGTAQSLQHCSSHSHPVARPPLAALGCHPVACPCSPALPPFSQGLPPSPCRPTPTASHIRDVFDLPPTTSPHNQTPPLLPAHRPRARPQPAGGLSPGRQGASAPAGRGPQPRPAGGLTPPRSGSSRPAGVLTPRCG